MMMHVDYEMPGNVRPLAIFHKCRRSAGWQSTQPSKGRRSKRIQMSVFHFPLGCLPSIPFCNSLPPSLPLLPLFFPSGGGINYTVAREIERHGHSSSAYSRRTDAEIELGIGGREGAAEWSADDEGTEGAFTQVMIHCSWMQCKLCI